MNDLELIQQLEGLGFELQEVDFEDISEVEQSYSIDENNNVIGLSLNELLLETIPEVVFQLKHLHVLRFRNNKINSIPPEICNLETLISLDLNKNRLSLLLNDIGKLTQLTSLDLSQNSIQELPDEIGDLNDLESLDLNNNKLVALPSKIGKLINLIDLGMVKNQVSELPEEFAKLTALEKLDLRDNLFKSFPSALCGLSHLKILDLNNNQLPSLPSKIKGLCNLQVLNLMNNQLTQLPPEIRALNGLRELDLRNNQLKDLPPEIHQLKLDIYQKWSSDRHGIFLDGNLDLPFEKIMEIRSQQNSFVFQSLKLENFTVFKKVEFQFSPGINVFVGGNGTGKTHLLKLLYSVHECKKVGGILLNKLQRVFLPENNNVSRLIRCHENISSEIHIQLVQDENTIILPMSFSIHPETTQSAPLFLPPSSTPGFPVYIPAKEMLANAPGFRSLYEERQIHFDETYNDIIHRAFIAPQRNIFDPVQQELLDKIADKLGGETSQKGEMFYLNAGGFEQEFSMLAEGLRKLALLGILIRNGSLTKGSVLYWDEPEANFNPSLMTLIIEILLTLERQGVQIFLATHNYATLKELELQSEEGQVKYFALSFNQKTYETAVNTASKYSDISPNLISDAYVDIYDRGVEKTFGRDE